MYWSIMCTGIGYGYGVDTLPFLFMRFVTFLFTAFDRRVRFTVFVICFGYYA